jgi:putative tricarboxylic transport membrane protein
MVLICMVSMRWFLRVTDVPQYVIVPVVLTCCVLGAFALNNRLTDIYLLAGIGLVGYALRKLDYPLAPLVLGVILGPIAETNLRRALMANEDWTAFLTRPVSAGLLALAVVSIALSLRSWRRLKAVEGGT